MTYVGSSASSRHATVIGSASEWGAKIRAFHVAVTPVSTAWPLANNAYAIPFLIDNPVTISEMFFLAGTTPGTTNCDLGIYREDFTLIASKGAFATTSVTDSVQPAGGGAFSTPVTLVRGRYYMAMSAAAITTTVRAGVYGNGFLRAMGCFKMATAHPLPATFTPASMGTDTFLPSIGCAIITNIL
jgi:hypothetical protein